MKKDTPSRRAPSRLAASGHVRSRHVPTRLATSKPAPSRRVRSRHVPTRLAPSSRGPRRPILALVLCLAAILAAVGGTFAIYSSQAFLRSVVRNQDTKAIRFSSDKLYRVPDETEAQKYYYPMSDEAQRTMVFQVCNYDQDQNTAFSEQDIGYTITFQVAKGTPDFAYTISMGDAPLGTLTTGQSVSFGHTLSGGKRNANAYTFTFGDEDCNKVELLVTVTPKDLTATRNTILNGILIPVAYATTQGVTVSAEFTDKVRGTPDQFDAYNLSVSVSGGKGDVKISWDNTTLDIDPFFISKVKGTVTTDPENPSRSYVIFPMNSEDETGIYLIQFYNHSSEKPTWTDWNSLDIQVGLVESSGESS